MIKQFLLFIIISILVVSCGTQATPEPQPTAEPTEDTEATEEAQSATTDLGDSPGAVLFTQFYEDVGFACITCHYPNTDNRLLGPGLLSVEERFETYDVDEETIEEYLEKSILEPTEFIVPDDEPFPENIMPRTYGELFSEEEIDQLIEFILSF